MPRCIDGAALAVGSETLLSIGNRGAFIGLSRAGAIVYFSMSIRGLLKFSLIGFALQLFIHLLSVFWGSPNLGESLFVFYKPWLEFGVILFDRLFDVGGHALSLGGILGYLLGILSYSLLFGVLVSRVEKYRRPV